MSKVSAGPAPARRAPQQARSLQKVELILEAAVRLIDRGDIDSLTTNALAKTAGISIGTLYQYFPDKQAVLAALIDREMAALSERIVKRLGAPSTGAPGDRVRLIVRAVLEAYGSRKRAHRRLLLYAMSRGDAGRLDATYGQLIDLFTGPGVTVPGGLGGRLTAAEAFVLTHAVAGVLRAMVAAAEPLPRDDVEEALVRLVIGFWPADDSR